MQERITCRECGFSKPADLGFYSKEIRGKRYHLQPCRQCQLGTTKKQRRDAKARGDYWYQEASGGRHRLTYSFMVQFGTRWHKLAPHYKRALRQFSEHLSQHRNTKARNVIRAHMDALPKTLPYRVYIEGDEWPLIAHMLIGVRETTDDDEYRRACTNLYNRFIKAKAKARYEHEGSRLPDAD